jgi:LmbE family N-acetylglucosaminyl deacetylase
VKAFDPDPANRWLFCMTHPDDEISICAWIKRLTSTGASVHVNWTHSNPIRELEGRAVAALLGVPDNKLSFMRATDGSVCDELDVLLPQFKDLIARVEPHRIVCGAFEQGHLDHDSTNWLVNQCAHVPVFEVPFYHPYTRRLQTMNRFATHSQGDERIALTPDEARLKIQVAKSFRSQNIWTVLWWYEAWQKTKLKPIELRKRELMRLQVHRDFRTPNLPPRLRSQVESSAPWQRWIAAMDRANMPP